MKISFVKPNYPFEKRVAILPHDLKWLLSSYPIEIVIEQGFGREYGATDNAYREAGAQIATREDCYAERVVFNLKLTQPSDYKYLKMGHTLIGWSHPSGSGNSFYKNICQEKNIHLIDIDSVFPRKYSGLTVTDINFFPNHFFWKNSYNAGIASIMMAEPHLPIDKSAKVCVLGSGSVSQGAFFKLSQIGFQPRMFYRKTLPIFIESLSKYDLIVNGIEMDTVDGHILTRNDLRRTKKGVLIIDAAADAGGAIEGTEYRDFNSPFGEVEGRGYFLVNNTPTFIYKIASVDISKVVATTVLPALFEKQPMWLVPPLKLTELKSRDNVASY